MAIEAGELVVCSALDFVRQDQAAVLSDADIVCLDAVLKGSGVVQSHHFQGLAVGDLTAPKGSVLAAPLKALLRRTIDRATHSAEARSCQH